MFGFYFKREWTSLWTSPLKLAAILFFAVISIWSVADGLSWYKNVQTVQAETPANLLTDQDEWFADLARVESGEETSPFVAQPISLTFLSVRPPSKLSPLAHGWESIHPHSALTSGWRSEASLFRRYEVEGPSVLRAGRMDLLFVVTVFLPLILLLLTFDVLSQERQAGRFRMFLVQGGSARKLLLARILATMIPLILIPSICVLAVAIITGATWSGAAIWISSLLAYTLFWAALAALIAIAFRRPISGALAILASWSLFVVLIPSGTQFLAQALYPVPSRVTYLTEAREAEGETRRNMNERAEVYMAEHAGMTDVPIEGVPGFYRSAYLSNIDINAKTAPLIETFEAQQSSQRQFVRVVQFLSPTLIFKDHLEQVSGTGAEQAAMFRAQARDHLGVVLDAIGPATVSRSRISKEAAEAIPQFAFQPRGVTFVSWMGMLFILSVTVLILTPSLRRAKLLS